MKKIILLFSLLLIFNHLSFAQDDEFNIGASSSERLIHIAYSPSTSAIFGLHAGWMGNNGGVLSDGSIIDAGGLYVAGRYNSRDILNLDFWSATLGVTLQLTEFAHVYLGGGYGKYVYPYNEPTILPDLEIKGVDLEAGFIIKAGAFTFHAGISDLDFQQLDLVGGIGYTF
ncbi:MAG: hypothetical protein L3J74_00220 [Bacteroidales bacterium]|nr:hypothetical protein [Bacteroidales bacterium]